MTAPNGDVLDRDPKTTGDAAQPVEEQLELPGFARADSSDIADEQEAKEKKRAKEAAALKDYLEPEELFEEIRQTFPERAEKIVNDVNELFGLLRLTVGPVVIPKVVAGAPKNNAHHIVDMIDGLQPFTDEFAIKALNGQKIPADGSQPFVASSGNGVITTGQKGIFFHAGLDDTGKAKKPFGPEEARSIALLAMHNKDLLPPNAIKITGTPEQRALIKAEVDKLNESLPESLRFNLDDGSKPTAPSASPKQERGPSLLDKFVAKVTGKPVGGTPATAASAPADDTLDLREEDIVPAPEGAGERLGKSMAQSMIDEVRGVRTAPEGPSERDILEDILNLYPDQIVKTAEKVGEFDTTDHGRQDLFKARIQTSQSSEPPFNGPETMKDVIFHQAGDKLRILAVEDDYMFDKLLKPAQPEQAASDLNKGFGAAGQGETPVVTQDDENFIGPRTPGWTPPSPPSA